MILQLLRVFCPHFNTFIRDFAISVRVPSDFPGQLEVNVSLGWIIMQYSVQSVSFFQFCVIFAVCIDLHNIFQEYRSMSAFSG